MSTQHIAPPTEAQNVQADDAKRASILHMPGDRALEPLLEIPVSELTEEDMCAILFSVHDSLKEKGYNPVTQILGFILTGDPAYIPPHNNARLLLQRLDRNDILTILLKHFFNE
jgi:uncharacterized protein (UPF0297 family)